MAIALTLFLLLALDIFQVNCLLIRADCASHGILQEDMPREAIPPFLRNTFYRANQLVRRAFRLKKFPRQAIHTTTALFHVVIALADASRKSETILDKPDGDPILTNHLFLMWNLEQ
jgi:hypothetical protein